MRTRAGIWNEDAWSVDYVKKLRHALDEAGFESTRIVLADGSASTSSCTDCPSSWRTLVDAVREDSALRAAVDVLGVHGSQPIAALPQGYQALGLRFWNSEQNIVDGPMPQVWRLKGGGGVCEPRADVLLALLVACA